LSAGTVQLLCGQEQQEAVWTRAALNASSCGTPLGTFGALAVQMGQRLCYLREVLWGWSAQEMAKRLGVRAESIERMDLALSRERGRGPRLLGICPPARNACVAGALRAGVGDASAGGRKDLEPGKGDLCMDQMGKAVSMYVAGTIPLGADLGGARRCHLRQE
jgi:hypothetical protein